MTTIVWNPHIVSQQPNCVECILVMPDRQHMVRGTDDFIYHLCSTIGVDADIGNWFIKPYRCKYFRDISEASGNSDSWRLVWKIFVVLNKAIDNLPSSSIPYSEIELDDNHFVYTGYHYNVNCLVLSDFIYEKGLLDAIHTIMCDSEIGGLQRHYGVSIPLFKTTNLPNGHMQLQIDLGFFTETFFTQGAGYASRMLRLCKNEGGNIYFRPHFNNVTQNELMMVK